jgi:hypothetical protein
MAALSGCGQVPSNERVTNDRSAVMLSPQTSSSSRQVAGSRAFALLGGHGWLISTKIGLAPLEACARSTDARSTIRSEYGKTSTCPASTAPFSPVPIPPLAVEIAA